MLRRIAQSGGRLAEQNPEVIGGAYGGSIDTDEDQYRKLSQADRDISPQNLERAVNICYWLYEKDPLFKRLIDVPIQAITSAGITIKCESDKAQEILTEFWEKPMTGLKHKFMDTDGLFHSTVMTGELNVPIKMTNGKFDYAYVDTCNVKSVTMEKGNVMVEDKVTLKDSYGATGKTYDIIRPRKSEALEGEIFHFGINKPVNATRGRPVLLSLLDWIDVNDQALFNEVERWTLLKALIFDVEIQGGQSDINAWLDANPDIKAGKPPKPSSVHWHNEKVKWNAVNPSLNAADSQILANMLRRHIQMGAGLSDIIMGYGDTTNVGEAREILQATMWMIETMQRVLVKMLTVIFTYKLQNSVGFVTEDGIFSEADAKMPFEVSANKVLARTLIHLATAFQQIVASLAIATEKKLMPVSIARKVMVNSLNQTGFEIDEQEYDEAFEVEVKEDETEDANRFVKQIMDMVGKNGNGTTDKEIKEAKRKRIAKRMKQNGKYKASY